MCVRDTDVSDINRTRRSRGSCGGSPLESKGIGGPLGPQCLIENKKGDQGFLFWLFVKKGRAVPVLGIKAMVVIVPQ